MLNFSTCSVTVISNMRVDNWKGEGKCCPITCQVSTEERLRYRSNHNRPWWQKGVCGQPHAPSLFSLGKRPSTSCIGGWGALGLVWMDLKNLAHTEVQTLNNPACSEALY